MIKNYFKIAYRNLVRSKFHSFINIAGLSSGMAVVILIGLWVYDETSFDKYHANYNRITQVMQHVTNNGEVGTWTSVPFPLVDELRKNYGSDFKNMVLTGGGGNHILTVGDKKLTKNGAFYEPQIADMLTLNMLKGTRHGLQDQSSILVSQSTAKALFGNTDPMDKLIKIDNKFDVKITGVYEDLPPNTTFKDVTFMATWDLFYNQAGWVKGMDDPWRPNAFTIYAELNDHADIDKVSLKIRDAKLNKVSKELAKKKPALFLHPMSKWHLYAEFKNGVNTGGDSQYVWLFSIVGFFVLLLACINFMNLSTARSEKRAKEVGIRKAIGSLKQQLVFQFLSESLLMALLSFAVSIGLVILLLPFFNAVSGKAMSVMWTSPIFWLLCVGFTLITGLIAGSYPAFYLSSFQPVKILKGTFKAGRFAAIPRKVLVVLQFSVCVVMIIGTVIVFKQIQYAKNRPIGYSNDGLISLPMVTDDIHLHYDAVKAALLQSNAVKEMAETSSPVTEMWNTTSGFDWEGKDATMSTDFPFNNVSVDYAKTVGLQFTTGRDFSRNFATDSSALLVNEAAVKFMHLKNPVGTTVRWFGEPYTIIGVIKDVVAQSPYTDARPTVFSLEKDASPFVLLKLNPALSASAAVQAVETVFKKFNPAQPFEFEFVDEAYARKFNTETRIGKLVGFFAVLAIVISCLGLFGMAAFMAEQRTKEIGVRKVLGATVFNLWQLLSKDFVLLVGIALLIASPLAYYFMNNWVQQYSYHTTISWWIFAAAGAGALIITILTVSFQAIKAATANPVRSLRSE